MLLVTTPVHYMLGEAKHRTSQVLGVTLRTLPGRWFLHGLNGVINVSELLLDMVSYENSPGSGAKRHPSARKTLTCFIKDGAHMTDAGDFRDSATSSNMPDLLTPEDSIGGSGDGPTKDMGTQSAPRTEDKGTQSRELTPIKGKRPVVRSFVYTCVVVKPLEIWLLVLRRLNKLLGDLANQGSKQQANSSWKKTLTKKNKDNGKAGLMVRISQSVLTMMGLRQKGEKKSLVEANMYLYVSPDRKDISPNKAQHSKRKYAADDSEDEMEDEGNEDDIVEVIGPQEAEKAADALSEALHKLANGVNGIQENGHDDDCQVDPTGTPGGAVHASCPAGEPQSPNGYSFISSDEDNDQNYSEVNGYDDSFPYSPDESVSLTANEDPDYMDQ